MMSGVERAGGQPTAQRISKPGVAFIALAVGLAFKNYRRVAAFSALAGVSLLAWRWQATVKPELSEAAVWSKAMEVYDGDLDTAIKDHGAGKMRRLLLRELQRKQITEVAKSGELKDACEQLEIRDRLLPTKETNLDVKLLGSLASNDSAAPNRLRRRCEQHEAGRVLVHLLLMVEAPPFVKGPDPFEGAEAPLREVVLRLPLPNILWFRETFPKLEITDEMIQTRLEEMGSNLELLAKSGFITIFAQSKHAESIRVKGWEYVQSFPSMFAFRAGPEATAVAANHVYPEEHADFVERLLEIGGRIKDSGLRASVSDSEIKGLMLRELGQEGVSEGFGSPDNPLVLAANAKDRAARLELIAEHGMVWADTVVALLELDSEKWTEAAKEHVNSLADDLEAVYKAGGRQAFDLSDHQEDLRFKGLELLMNSTNPYDTTVKWIREEKIYPSGAVEPLAAFDKACAEAPALAGKEVVTERREEMIQRDQIGKQLDQASAELEAAQRAVRVVLAEVDEKKKALISSLEEQKDALLSGLMDGVTASEKLYLEARTNFTVAFGEYEKGVKALQDLKTKADERLALGKDLEAREETIRSLRDLYLPSLQSRAARRQYLVSLEEKATKSPNVGLAKKYVELLSECEAYDREIAELKKRVDEIPSLEADAEAKQKARDELGEEYRRLLDQHKHTKTEQEAWCTERVEAVKGLSISGDEVPTELPFEDVKATEIFEALAKLPRLREAVAEKSVHHEQVKGQYRKANQVVRDLGNRQSSLIAERRAAFIEKARAAFKTAMELNK